MRDKKKDRRFVNHYVDHYDCLLSYGRKKRGRIRYLNWATELYGCLDEEIEENILQDSPDNKESFQRDE